METVSFYVAGVAVVVAIILVIKKRRGSEFFFIAGPVNCIGKFCSTGCKAEDSNAGPSAAGPKST